MKVTTAPQAIAAFGILAMLAAAVQARGIAQPLKVAATDLGTLGGTFSNAMHVNSRGQIVGASFLADDVTERAYIWERGRMTDIGTLGGGNTWANDLNNTGAIAGESETAVLGRDGFPMHHAFLWYRGRTTDLGTLGGEFSIATALNEKEDVVGGAETASGVVHAFVWSRGVMMDIGNDVAREMGSVAVGINNRGQVIGMLYTFPKMPFLWERGKVTFLTPPEMGGDAQKINERGQILGQLGPPFGHSFLWDRGVFTDLGSLDINQPFYTPAHDLNERGQVVGMSNTAYGQHAFLWDRGQMVDLGTLGGFPSEAYAVNNRAQAVGASYNADGVLHAALWQRGEVIDLGAGWAFDINESGVSVGMAPVENGEVHGARWVVVHSNRD